MKLEHCIHFIRDVQYGGRTGLREGVLTVDRDELRQLLERDRHFSRVDIELASPGESVRIFQVVDVIEPRAKSGLTREDIADFSCPVTGVGEGQTRVLRGAAVVLVDDRIREEGAAGTGVRDQIIDMSGPGSEISTYGQTHNIVLVPRQKRKTNIGEYQRALKMAGLKTAAYLAHACESLPPDEIETFDMPSLTEVSHGLESLPKVTYIFQIISFQYEPLAGEPTYFGVQVNGIVPTILHPNQVLDGAVTAAWPNLNLQTYQIQNHPIVKELYRRHGRDFCFSGVIATVAPNNVFDIDTMAKAAANMAKWVVGADGAILTKTGGGAPELALAKTAQCCEQLGIKTAIAMLHMGADVRDAKYGASTIFDFPEVDTIVSMGFPSMQLELPSVKKVIGRSELLGGDTPEAGNMVKSLGTIYGTLCQVGSSKYKAVRY